MENEFGYANIRGFNYIPSYSGTIFETWEHFDKNIWQREIERGKEYFPKFNCLRIWLSFYSFLQTPNRFIKNLATVLEICDNFKIKVMPTLFNRCHHVSGYEIGGIYYDHFVSDRFNKLFEEYLSGIILPFKDDERILMWDLCNEPQVWDKNNLLHKAEIEWLTFIAEKARECLPKQPITIGTMFGTNVEILEPLCDVICIHPYGGWWNGSFAKMCDWAVELARNKKKDLIANETCQGSLNDEVRVQIIRITLKTLKERGIGWCVWHLHGGKMITANREITDANCKPGDRSYMAFIEPSGKIRPGHEVFNEF